MSTRQAELLSYSPDWFGAMLPGKSVLDQHLVLMYKMLLSRSVVSPCAYRPALTFHAVIVLWPWELLPVPLISLVNIMNIEDKKDRWDSGQPHSPTKYLMWYLINMLSANASITYRSRSPQCESDLDFHPSMLLKIKRDCAIGLAIYGLVLMFNSSISHVA